MGQDIELSSKNKKNKTDLDGSEQAVGWYWGLRLLGEEKAEGGKALGMVNGGWLPLRFHLNIRYTDR